MVVFYLLLLPAIYLFHFQYATRPLCADLPFAIYNVLLSPNKSDHLPVIGKGPIDKEKFFIGKRYWMYGFCEIYVFRSTPFIEQ